jgi:putative ABC transport system substrate-binding protein
MHILPLSNFPAFLGISSIVSPAVSARLDRPSGNVTGFANYEASLGGKWLELLSEIAPAQAGRHHVQS